MSDTPSSKRESSPPSGIPEDQNSGGSGTCVRQLLTGKNSKVAPAAPNTTTGSETSTSVGAAVLLLIPKKSDAVCVEMCTCDNQPDDENNPIVAQQQAGSQEANCSQGQGQSEAVAVKPTQSYDSYEEVCRICHDNPSKLELISPCLCKGSMNKVHRTCLERWLGESAKNSCEICGYEYNTVRKPKYKGCRSVYQWIRHPLSPSDTRNLFFDIACFFILTPLAAISSWLCVVGAQHYTFGEERRRRSKYHDPAWLVHGRPDPRAEASNATWTSVGLLSLTGTLLVAYSVWLFVAIKYHIQAWRDWQQRNFTVTIVPFEDGCMGRPPPPRPARQATPSGNNNVSNSNQIGERSSSSNNNNSAPYGFFGSSGYGYDYDHLGVSSYLRYNGHNSLTTRGRGRNLIRHGGRRNRPRENYLNLPPIFSRSHFLRNPPPGYTISETALLYQALYGNDSDTVLNENFLSFFADSSEDVTESSSMMISGQPPPTPNTNLSESAANPACPVHLSYEYEIAEVHKTRSGHESLGVESPSTSTDSRPQQSNNNNSIEIAIESSQGQAATEPQPGSSKSEAPANGNNNDFVIKIENNDEKEKNKNEVNGDEIV